MSGELLTLAARMVRLEGGCESGHKPGQWHVHEDQYHATGAYLSELVRGQVDQGTVLAKLTGHKLMDPCDACGGVALGCLWCEERGWRWVRSRAIIDQLETPRQ